MNESVKHFYVCLLVAYTELKEILFRYFYCGRGDFLNHA